MIVVLGACTPQPAPPAATPGVAVPVVATATTSATATEIPVPTGVPATHTPAPEPTAATATYAGKIGVDLGGVGGNGLEFVDVARTMRVWETINADACPENDNACRRAPVDTNGDPGTDARTVFFDLRPFGLWWGSDQSKCPLCADGDFQIDVSGVYTLAFEGQAKLSTAEGTVEIRAQRYDASTNQTRAEIVLPKGNGLIFINFAETRRTPESPLNSGISRVRFIRPGFDLDTKTVFMPHLLKAIEPFDTLRFMTWTGGNNINPPFDAKDNTLEWAERNTPGAIQTLQEGVAWEHVIALANAGKKNVWINVPIHASEDYIRELARLFKRDLHPDAVIYIESSNEVWNSLFDQFNYTLAAARAEVAKGGSVLNADGETDNYAFIARHHVRRLYRISAIFGEEFGRPAINTKVRVVYAWQVVAAITYGTHLTWAQKTLGEPKDALYAVAGGPYFSNEGVQSDASVDDILAVLRNSSDNSVRFRAELREAADAFGLRMLAYEGGPDTATMLQFERNSDLLAQSITAHRDPRMTDLVMHDIRDNWFEHPRVRGDLFMFFTLNSQYNRWGMWGLTEDPRVLDTPKYLAIKALTGR
jgi:hypothetical protein